MLPSAALGPEANLPDLPRCGARKACALARSGERSCGLAAAGCRDGRRLLARWHL